MWTRKILRDAGIPEDCWPEEVLMQPEDEPEGNAGNYLPNQTLADYAKSDAMWTKAMTYASTWPTVGYAHPGQTILKEQPYPTPGYGVDGAPQAILYDTHGQPVAQTTGTKDSQGNYRYSFFAVHAAAVSEIVTSFGQVHHFTQVYVLHDDTIDVIFPPFTHLSYADLSYE